MRARRSAVLAAVCVSTILCAAVAHAAAEHSYVVRGNVIGGFPTRTGTSTQAFTVFGGPISSTQDGFFCSARWPDGLQLVFKRRLPYAKWSKACRVLTSAVITGRLWRTNTGLRVGAAESAIKVKYSKASSVRVGSTTKWNLVPGLNPALQAWTKKGRIASFHLVRH